MTTGKDIIIESENILPRWRKTKDEKKLRSKKKAEVFTPSWVIDKMVSDVFDNKIDSTYLEITCGEAPFITCRYEPETGQPCKRVGILDRKLELCSDINAAITALKSCYGYEWSGNSLLIARQNVYDTMKEWFVGYGFTFPQKEILEIIRYNFWQMDGLTGCVPNTDIECYVMDWKTNTRVKYKNN